MKLTKQRWAIVGLSILIAALAGILVWLVLYRHDKPAPAPATDSAAHAGYTAAGNLPNDLGLKLSKAPDSELVYVKTGNAYSFSSKALMAKAGGPKGVCGPSQAPLGDIVRVDKSSLGDSSTYSDAELKDLVRSGYAKSYSDYYLLYENSQAPCSDDQAIIDLQGKEKAQHSVFELFSLIETK